jgi:hypothetical protein
MIPTPSEYRGFIAGGSCGELPVSGGGRSCRQFPSVPIVSDASGYCHFTRLDEDNLWIDVLSQKLGWMESKSFEFIRIQ